MDAGTCCGEHSAMSAWEPLLQRRAHDIRYQIELTGFGCLILTVRERPAPLGVINAGRAQRAPAATQSDPSPKFGPAAGPPYPPDHIPFVVRIAPASGSNHGWGYFCIPPPLGSPHSDRSKLAPRGLGQAIDSIRWKGNTVRHTLRSDRL